MRTFEWLMVGLCLVAVLGGCGVVMDAAHTSALQQSIAYSNDMAQRADGNQLSDAQVKEALHSEANQWNYFGNATQGK
jgi:hypothetical protein